MPREDETPTTGAPPAPAPVSRRKFLATVAVAAAAAPALGSLIAGEAEAATRAHGKHAPGKAAPPKAPETPAAPNGARPDYSVAKTPQEHEALEKQWKQTVELVQALRKTPVPLGAEFATGALAPKRLRREAN